MKTRKSRITNAALIGLTSALIAGCGSAGGNTTGGGATSGDEHVAAMAAYKGADRQAKLESCAKKEGSATFYTGMTDDFYKAFVKAFEKKYPYLKVKVFRASSPDLIQRFTQEEAAHRPTASLIDVVRANALEIADSLTPMYSPEAKHYSADAIGPNNKFILAHILVYGWGYNTDKVAADEVPKNDNDLLDPKWRGQMAMSGSTYGVLWAGVLKQKYGEDMLRRFGAQNIRVSDTTSTALADQIASGEVTLGPAIGLMSVKLLRETGAPIGWLPIDALRGDGVVAIPKDAPAPCTAMLMVDFLLSKAGQHITVDVAKYASGRTGFQDPQLKGIDIADPSRKTDDYATAYRNWADLLDKYIVQKD